MKRMAGITALLFGLGFGGSALAQQATDDDFLFGDDTYEYEYGVEDEGLGAGAPGADDFATDEYGVYDEDYAWETQEGWYNNWYGDADDDWFNWF